MTKKVKRDYDKEIAMKKEFIKDFFSGKIKRSNIKEKRKAYKLELQRLKNEK